MYGICCVTIDVSSEPYDECCIKVNIDLSYCADGESAVIIQQYDDSSGVFVDKFYGGNDKMQSYILCAESGETTIQYRVRIANPNNQYKPLCGNSDEWTEGLTQFSGTVDINNCCKCPPDRKTWIATSLFKSRDCPGNGCAVNLLGFNIPPEYSCYKNYQLQWVYNGHPDTISPILSIENDPLYLNGANVCIPQNSSVVLRVYLYKDGQSNKDSACYIGKIFSCLPEIPSFDTTTNICSPDCSQVPWEPIGTARLAIPEGSECYVYVIYTYRTACPPTNYQDLQILGIKMTGNCLAGLSGKKIYQLATLRLIKENPMGFKPQAGKSGCDSLWRIVKASCWRNMYSIRRIVPDLSNPDPMIDTSFRFEVSMQQCEDSPCCVQSYTVCRDSAGGFSVIQNELITNNNDTSTCIVLDDFVMPFFPSNNPFVPFYPDLCYSSCNWVNISEDIGPRLYSFSTKSTVAGNIDNKVYNTDLLSVDCGQQVSCNIRIDYYYLTGEKVYTLNKTIFGNDYIIKVSDYIN